MTQITSAKMRANCSELNKLKNIQHTLDQAQEQFIQILSKDHPSMRDFVEKLNHKRKSETKCIQENVLNISNKMKMVTTKISSANDNSTALLKNDLVDIKQCISTFKCTIKENLGKLQKQENAISDDLNYCKQLYENWSQPIEIIEEPTFIKQKILNKIDCPEVHEYDKFLRENQGHTHGWSWDDNAMFLKIKSKHKTIQKVCTHVHKIFPDKSIEEIEEHCKWHETYCNLRNKQKLALLKWKEKKLENVKADIDTDHFQNSKLTKKLKVPPIDPELNKAKILKWKEEKRIRQKEESITIELNNKLYEQVEILRNQKKLEIKEKVEKWRNLKTSEKRTIEFQRKQNELKARTFKAMLANHFIREFQTQDMKYIRKRQALAKKRNNIPIPIKPSANILTSRNPDRILMPTKNWISKLNCTAEDMSQHKQINLNSIQKLKAPEWRK